MTGNLLKPNSAEMTPGGDPNAQQAKGQTEAVQPTTTTTAQTDAGALKEASASTPTPEDSTKKPEEDLSSRFAALSRKEKAILERERAFKEREASYSKHAALIEAIEKKDTMKLLEAGAIDINDVIQAALKQGEEPSTEEKVAKTVEQKLQEWREEQEKKRQEDEEKVTQDRYREEVEAFNKTLTTHLEENQEQYEFIHALGAQEQVFNAIHAMIVEDPDSYPDRASAEALIPQMAKEIEDALSEQAEKFGQTKKFKSRFSEALLAEGVKEPAETSHSPRVVREVRPEPTLTNRHAAPPAPGPERPRKLSREESIAAAARKLQEMLNQKNAQA